MPRKKNVETLRGGTFLFCRGNDSTRSALENHRGVVSVSKLIPRAHFFFLFWLAPPRRKRLQDWPPPGARFRS